MRFLFLIIDYFLQISKFWLNNLMLIEGYLPYLPIFLDIF